MCYKALLVHLRLNNFQIQKKLLAIKLWIMPLLDMLQWVCMIMRSKSWIWSFKVCWTTFNTYFPHLYYSILTWFFSLPPKLYVFNQSIWNNHCGVNGYVIIYEKYGSILSDHLSTILSNMTILNLKTYMQFISSKFIINHTNGVDILRNSFLNT